MRKMMILITVILSGMYISCGSSNVDNVGSLEYNQMLERVKDLEFEIENEWATPMKYSRINLFGNPNKIEFENDSVEVFLPYFGERHAGGGYNGEGAIQFKGIPKDLEIEENPERGTMQLSFSGRNNTENLDFLITIFPGGNTRTSVTSSQRDIISYDGKIKSSEQEDR